VFSKEIIDAISQLEKHSVKYIVVGGIAVVAYGYDRTTGDIDFWIDNDETNLKALENALLACEFDAKQVKEAIESYRTKSHLTITIDDRFPFDLMPVYSSYVSFSQAYEKSVLTEFFGINLRVVDLDTLIDMKIRSGRDKDLNDVQELKNIHKLK
jgi:predicted nucleotidyltransferase